jgi:very-short-patch-repair endonuclease
MAPSIASMPGDAVWELARRQHGVVARGQLLERGVPPDAIRHALKSGRLHPLWRGVYALGRPEVSQRGRWTAAVLACGSDARLSHRSAACLWGVYPRDPEVVEVVVGAPLQRRRAGVRVRRQAPLPGRDGALREGIPVTAIAPTLVDLAATIGRGPLERAINEADRLDLIDPESLGAAIAPLTRRPGLRALREVLGRERTDSSLERRFLGLVRSAGLRLPQTQVHLNGYRVDFFWPEHGLVVEVDGLRYHRTPLQQAADRRRDQAHTAAGLTTLRFAEHQVRSEPQAVQELLRSVTRRLSR